MRLLILLSTTIAFLLSAYASVPDKKRAIQVCHDEVKTEALEILGTYTPVQSRNIC